jgi:hypothetical protein
MSVLSPEKPTMISHLENGDTELNVKDARSPPLGDYSGAMAKDDPAELALVRKLDWRIMPTLWCMYFMNYVRIPFLHSIFGSLF